METNKVQKKVRDSLDELVEDENTDPSLQVPKSNSPTQD